MSAEMLIEILKIVNNPDPLPPGEMIPVPKRQWFKAAHSWLPLPQNQYLFDWMIQDHTSVVHPQPAKEPLVEKYYRKKFLAVQHSWNYYVSQSKKHGLYSHTKGLKGLAIPVTIYEEDEDEDEDVKDESVNEKEGEWFDFGSGSETLTSEKEI